MKVILISISLCLSACGSMRSLHTRQQSSAHRYSDSGIQQMEQQQLILWQDSSHCYVEIVPEGIVAVDWERGFNGSASSIKVYRKGEAQLKVQQQHKEAIQQGRHVAVLEQSTERQRQKAIPNQIRVRWYGLVMVLVVCVAIYYFWRRRFRL